MPQKFSPNRRRSIAVLNQGGGSSRASHRRRAYSIVPGEKLSPAARARNLVPRKSILKADITDSTQSMDITEIQPPTSRKSLGRRVSFASHAHVRLFEVQDPNASGSADQSPSPAARDEDDSDNESRNVRQSQEAPTPHTRRRSSQRRRSSTAFTEFGEQSMEMDEGDSALDPQDFLNRNEETFDDDNEEEDEEDDYGEDMDMTTAIPREFIRKRSLSLGGPSQPFVPRRRSSVALATSSSSHSENQVYPRTDSQTVQQQPPPQDSIYPSLQLEDILNLPPEEQEHADVPQRPNEDVTSSTMQFDTDGEDITESSGGDNTQPMEFTIPVVRPPPPPSKEWLQLRAMTHAGSEPYEPPPHEPSDDPEANAIVSLDRDGEETPMDLTDALNRLQKARTSLALPPASDNGHPENFYPRQNADIDGFQDDTFTSTEDSFDDGFDGDRTINVTKLRQSLGAASRRDESMDTTSVYGEDVAENINREIGTGSQENRNPPDEHLPHTSHPATSSADTAKAVSDAPPVFSLPSRNQTSVFSLATTTPATSGPSVFSLPSASSTSTVFAAPSGNSHVQNPPKSPGRSVPTVPKPFTFSLDSRLGTPSKGKQPDRAPSPSKIPVHRGTAAFAPVSTPKSLRKRPAAPDDDIGEDRDLPSPAKKQAVGKLSPSKKAVFEHPSAPAPAINRRTSAVRRPSGYFAQRKSLAGGALNATSSLPDLGTRSSDSRERTPVRMGIQQRASLGAIPLEDSAPLYPDLSRIEESVTSSPKPPVELYPDVSAIAQEHSPLPAPPVSRRSPSTAVANPSSLVDREGPGDRVNDSQTAATLDLIEVPPLSGAVDSIRSVSPIAPSTEPPPRSASPKHVAPRQQATPDERVSSTQALSLPIVQTNHEEHMEEEEEEEGDMELTEQWRDGLQNADDMYPGEEPSISVEQFFQMTGIRFMDELTAPRRSTIRPGQLCQNRRRSLTSSHSEEAEPVPLAEFMMAMAVEVPQLELYSVLASELTAWIEESKKICRQAEEDAIKVTPALFREFADADESEKSDLVHQLKLIKAYDIGMAKSQWYDWKSQWVGQLQNSAAEAFSNLESDAKVLEDITNQAQAMLPALRAEYEQAARELAQEEVDVAELQNSDKDYLNELKVSIAEQDAELQAFKANVSEAEAKLKRLDEKLADIETQKQENVAAIAQAERIVHIQTESTSSEVYRLREELEALQDLHLWRTTKLHPSSVEFEYASRYIVSIQCVNFRPVLAQLDISRMRGSRLKQREPFPQLTQLMLDGGRYIARTTPGEVDIRKILQRLGDFWSSCAQIRSQLTFLSIKYPLSIQLLSVENSTPSFKTTATVLFPTAKSKAFISFTLDSQTYSHWPLSIASIKSDVEVAYGGIERQKILDAVLTRLSQATPSESHGCLLDACIEATEQFTQT